MATLRLEIVTPEEKIYSEDVDMVTLPGSEGELGVYPKHVPLLTTVVPGELRVLKDGRERSMAIGEGFVEIKGDAASVKRLSISNSVLGTSTTSHSGNHCRQRRLPATVGRRSAKSRCEENKCGRIHRRDRSSPSTAC